MALSVFALRSYYISVKYARKIHFFNGKEIIDYHNIITIYIPKMQIYVKERRNIKDFC